MHDAAFATAALQPPVKILGLWMRPFAIGHQLWLEAEHNPLAGPEPGAAIRAHHVVEAAWICAHNWAELEGMSRAWLTPLKLALWCRRCRGEDLAVAAVDFQNYRRAGSSLPPVDPSDAAGGRPGGAPLLSRLIQFLVSELGKSEAEALNYPLGLAQWHFSVNREREGALKILNEGELEFEAWCAEQDALRALRAKSEGRNPKAEGNPKTETRS